MQIIRHPDYALSVTDWLLYRSVMGKSSKFIDDHLYPLTDQDNSLAYRRQTAYNPGYVKYGITRIKNAIFDRMDQITRTGGSPAYQNAMRNNIDRRNNSMNHFISTEVLLDLMVMGRIGVMVDNNATMYASDRTPYLYTYQAEDILNWHVTLDGLQMVLLCQRVPSFSSDGLVNGTEFRYQYIQKTSNGVLSMYLDASGKVISSQELDLPRIPFVLIDLPYSLIDMVAKHQVAALNLASQDMYFGLRANIPFYTEQIDSTYDFAQSQQKEETKIEIGVSKGRQYPKGLERPQFINPSTDPLHASIEKQRQIQEDVDKLLDLAVSNLTASRVSEGTRKTEFRGLEGGLSALGKFLEAAENMIALIWSDYESSNSIARVIYPNSYQMESDDQRLTNGEKTCNIFSRIESKTAKQMAAKKVIANLLGPRTSKETLDTIDREIDKANYVIASEKKLQWFNELEPKQTEPEPESEPEQGDDE